MNKIKIFSLLIVFILVFQNTLAQNQQIVSKFEKVQDLQEYSLRISFHSWGEGRTEQLNLDQYFPVKRDPNSRYAYLAPPEISVRIDQNTGIAYLQAFEDWTGTREIIFSLTDVFNLESTISSLQKYREIITQQRAPVRLKEQFQDLPSYHLFEKILDGLETQKPVPLKIEVNKVDNNVKVNIGAETRLELDLETLTEDNLKTLKPKIGITIQPESKKSVEGEQGFSFFIFIPLILIGITLIIFAAVYIKKNKEKFRKYFKKEKLKQTVENKLNSYKRELSEIQNKIGKEQIEKSTDSAFKTIKEFFNEVTPADYQFSYSEIKKEELQKELSDKLKENLCSFSKDISDIRFKGESVSHQNLKKIIIQAKNLIEGTAEEEKYIASKKEREILSKKFPINTIKYVLDSFREESTSSKKIQERLDVKKQAQNIFHKLGIIKTLAEKELERKRKFSEKLKKIKDKEKEAELERKRKEQEKKRKEFLKLRAKQEKEHLKWLEAQRKIHEIQKKQEEKRRKRLARARTIRKYFHDKFGLFKTVKDLEKELEEKRKKRLEKEKEKRLAKRRKKQAILNFLHFLRLYKTQEEKHQEELILKKEERLEKQRKERKREARKQAVLNFLHALKFYRTQEEVEREKERRLRKLRKEHEEKEEKFHEKELSIKRKQLKEQEQRLEKLKEKQEKKHLKALEKEKRKVEFLKKKKELRKYLHDKFGLFKTEEEKHREKEKKYQEKLRKQKLKEKQKELKLQAEKKGGELARKNRKDQIEKINSFLRNKLKKYFGLYRTKTELEVQKQKIKGEIAKKQEKKKQKEQKKLERRRKIRKFLHDKLGFFKTSEEIEAARAARKEHRIELEHKLEDTVLKALASRLERKKLTPEQEIKILMQMEQEALRKGDIESSRDIQKKINKIYKEVKKSKHRLFLLNKFRNKLESIRDYLFSSEKNKNLRPSFIRDLSSKIRNSLAPKIERAKIEQIAYLVEKSEIELRRNKKQEAREFYQRAVHLYRSMNQPSRRMALNILLKMKHQITSAAVSDSLEKAFGAIYTGQVKRAENLFKNIDVNFATLPIKEKEKLYDDKERLYQKIREQSKPKKGHQKIELFSKIRKLFSKKDNSSMFPLVKSEEKFKPRETAKEIQEKETKDFRKKESLSDFILARKPKFTSIKTELISSKQEQSLAKKLFEHIRRAESHLERKNHEKAHENYKQAIDVFKDANLAPEIRDNVYKNLGGIKEKILHTSMHNFFKKTKEAVKKEEVEHARKLHQTLEGIYNHLHTKKQKEISELMKKQEAGIAMPDSAAVERKLDQAFAAIRSKKYEEALSLYNQINSHYNNLVPEDKKQIYPKLSALYSELIKNQRR